MIAAAASSLTLSGSAAAQGGPPPAPVRVDAVTSEELAPKSLVTGDLHAPRWAQIAAREGGIVSEMPIEAGQRVERGDILAQLDDTRLAIQINQNAAARLAAEAARNEHTASLAKLRRDEERIRSAYDAGASNIKELEDILGDIDVAEARLATANQQIEIIDLDKEMLDQRMKDMTIAAPFNGVIMARLTEIGEWIGEGDAVAEVLQTDTIEAWMRVPQSHYEMLSKPDAQLTIQIDATGKQVTSRGLRILPDIDVDARSFTAIVSLDNKDRALAPGMSVIGWAPLREPQKYLTIHKDAILKGDVGEFVFVVRAAGSGPPLAVTVRAQTLFPSGQRFAVRAEDLKVGDMVIVEGNERLFPGALVTIVTDENVPPGDGNHSGGGNR